MDKKTLRMFNFIICGSLVFTLSMTIATNPVNWRRLLPLSIILVLSAVLRRWVLLRPGVPKALADLTIVLDLVIIYFISLSDMSRVSEIYFYILIIEAVFHFPIRLGVASAVVIYFEYVFIRFVRYNKWNFFDFNYFSPAIYENALYFIFVFLIVFTAKRQFAQSQTLSRTMAELEMRTRQYGETNQKLQDTLIKLEEMTVLKERNRIAREIHDTVGHTLTTVLIEIEAGKRLVSKDPDLAIEKLDLAQEQIRKGLDDIRHSVHTLKDGSDLLTLVPALKSLISDTERHAGVKIDFDYDSDLPITEAQSKVLFSALQEGLTNGIRHGGCSSFRFTLKRSDDKIRFTLKDDGRGCDDVSPGFGLNAMRERVIALGGVLDIESRAGEGFCLNITIPIEEEGSGNACEDSDSR
jgi:signal transduction histidine kinase